MFATLSTVEDRKIIIMLTG